VRRQDELQQRKGLLQEFDDLLLPAGVQVHINLVDQEHSRSTPCGFLSELRVETHTTARNVCDQRDGIADSVA
jgi:hypothetical protein